MPVLFLVGTLALLVALPATANTRQIVYSEEFFPYAYETTTGEAQGISVELTKRILQHQKLEPEFRFLPFQRALLLVETQPDALLINLVRLRERETKFHWLYPLFCTQAWLYGLKETPTPQSLSDLPKLSLQYTFGTVRGSTSYKRLLELGVPDHRIEVVDSFDQNLAKLWRGRVNYITGLNHVETLTPRAQQALVPKIAIAELMPFYLVSGKLSSQQFIQQWQTLTDDKNLSNTLRDLRFQHKVPECPTQDKR